LNGVASPETKGIWPNFHPQIRDTLVFSRNQAYKELKFIDVIGFSPSLRSAPYEINDTPIDYDDYFREFVSINPKYQTIINDSECCPSSLTEDRFLKSIFKCDAPCIKPNNPKLELAINYTKRMLWMMVNQKAQNKVDYNPNTTNGVPYNRMTDPVSGKLFATKRDLIESPIWQTERDRRHTPIFQVFGKREYLPIIEAQNERKLRTVFCGETPFVMAQKAMFDKADKALHDAHDDYFGCWSRYGHVKQYGGFDRLGKAHLDLPRRLRRPLRKLFSFTADVSGWDRKLPLLAEVYRIRKELYGEMSQYERELFDYILEGIVSPYCSLPDGTVIRRKSGNVSGSGKTTTDNTIAHIIIHFYLFITLYEDLHGCFPSYAQIVDFIVDSLYGDDSFTSLFLSDWTPDGCLDPLEYFFTKLFAVYAEFGLEIKRKQFNYRFGDIDGLEFLGATFTKVPTGHYMPQPRYGKLFTTISQNLEGNKEPIAYASTCAALNSLVFGLDDPKGRLLQSFVKDYSQFLLNKLPRNSLPVSVVDELIKMASGVSNASRISMGYESCPVFSVKFIPQSFFFSGQLDTRGHRRALKESEMTSKNINCINDLNFSLYEKYPRGSVYRGNYNPNINYVGAFLEFCQGIKLPSPTLTFSHAGPQHCLRWSATCSYNYAGDNVLFVQTPEMESKQDSRNFVFYRLINEPSVAADKINIVQSAHRGPEDPYAIACQLLKDYHGNQGLFAPTHSEDPASAVSSKVLHKVTAPVASASSVTPPGGYTPSVPLNNETNLFFLHLIRALRSYVAMAPEDRHMHFLSTFLDLNDLAAAARLATMHKTGGFNPYGNGQTAQNINYFQPSMSVQPDGTWECVSTITFSTGSPIACFGRGIDELSSYEDWSTNAALQLNRWAPSNPLNKFLVQLRTLPIPPDNHPLKPLWTDDHAIHRFMCVMEGSFNPYGNGQPKLTQAQYLLRNKVAFDKEGLKPAQRLQRYKTYAVKSAKGPLATTPQGNHNNVSLTKKQEAAAIKTSMATQSEYTRRNAIMANKIFQISVCARYYFAALVCPFWWVDSSCDASLKGLNLDPEEKENPCIPTVPNVKTRKFFAFVRGTFAVTVNGFTPNSANICLAPRRMLFDYPPDSASPPVYIQSSTFNSGVNALWATTLDQPVGLVAGQLTANLNSEYLSPSAILVNGKGIKYRVVGAGLRVRYTAPEISRGGTLHVFVHPNHDTLAGLDVVALGNFETYFRVPMTRNWTTVTHTPVLENDFQFLPDFPFNPSAFGTYSTNESFAHYMGMTITDCANGTFEYEAIVHFEAIGQTVRGLTPTPVDMPGLSVVLNSATPQALPDINKSNNLGSLLKDGLETVTGLAPEVMKFAKMMI
jgi:hypothetical protein